MPVDIIQCGDLSSVIITVEGAPTWGNIVVAGSDMVGSINMNLGTTQVLDFVCKGQATLTYPALLTGVVKSLVTPMSHGIWTDNFLMGLAGLICGALLAFVLSKYAV